MLDLKRIRKTSSYIEAEYYPEGSAERLYKNRHGWESVKEGRNLL